MRQNTEPVILKIYTVHGSFSVPSVTVADDNCSHVAMEACQGHSFQVEFSIRVPYLGGSELLETSVSHVFGIGF